MKMNPFYPIVIEAFTKLNRLHRETLQNLKWIERDDCLSYWKTVAPNKPKHDATYDLLHRYPA